MTTAKIPTKRRREVQNGADLIVFDPAFKESNYPGSSIAYHVELNGERVGWIEYEWGVRAGHRFMTYGIGWTRLTSSRSWPSPVQVWRLSPFTLETLSDLASRIPEWAATGKVKTKAAQAVAVTEWQATEDAHDAERKARYAAEAAERKAAAELAQEAAHRARVENHEAGEALAAMRDRLRPQLTNFEIDSIERAIKVLSR